MLVYSLLRALGRLALRWYYRDVELVGVERVPRSGPVLLASNHPNALVDALVIACTLERPVTLTAKATLLDHPLTRMLMRAVGVVPLRRASDEHARRVHDADRRDPPPNLSRNDRAFDAVLDVLERGGMVLLFPEGKSHNEPELAPVKTGLARIALMAREDRRIDHLPIVPIGLTFEKKWEPRSRVLMQVGTPLVAGTEVSNDTTGVVRLTEGIADGLRQVTLNFEADEEAQRTLAISSLLAQVFGGFRPLYAPDPPLAEHVRLAQRVAVLASHLGQVDHALVNRVEHFLERLTTFGERAQETAVAASDLHMNVGIGSAIWFVVRELVIALFAGPLAIWGRVNHWAPLRLARMVALRTSRTPDEPAMRTIVVGLVLVLAFYVVQTTLVALLAGWVAGLVYVASLPVSASWDLRYADRRRRAIARIGTYVRLRRDPALRNSVAKDIEWLRSEALGLNDLIEHELRWDGSRANQSLAGLGH